MSCPVSARSHADPVDAQQGAVEDHERLPARDLDRLGQSRRHRREQRDRLADVAVDGRGTDLESAGELSQVSPLRR
jgi:hypothetical protein